MANCIKSITGFNLKEITEDTKNALDIHNNIIAAETKAAEAMTSLCQNLKEMRDTKLYQTLGYEKFGDYTEEACGIKGRQALYYISTYEKLGLKFMQSNAELGITKLHLLADVCAPDRADFVKNNNLEEMNVAEVKELVERTKQQGEQINILEAQNKSLSVKAEELKNNLTSAQIAAHNSSIEAERLQKEKERLEKECEHLQNRPVEVAVKEPSPEQIAEIAEEQTAHIKEDYEKLLQEQKLHSENELQKIKKAHSEEIEKLKKLKNETSASKDVIIANQLFIEIQEKLDELMAVISDIEKNEDTATSAKIKNFLADTLEQKADRLKS